MGLRLNAMSFFFSLSMYVALLPLLSPEQIVLASRANTGG
jgi:hypothetical protein